MHLSFSKFLQSNFPHKSVLSLSNAIVGASVLSMPYCFQECGIILATLLMIICAIITSYSCKILIASAQATHSTTYEYLGLRAMGRSMKFMVELSSIGLLCGSIVAYQMIIGDLGSTAISQGFHITNSPFIRACVILILTCTVSFPLSLSERFDHLTPISIQSIIFYLLFCIYTFSQLWFNSETVSFNMDKLIYWKWSGLFISLPIVSLSFSCQTMLFVVFSELSESTSHAINDIIDLSVTLVGLIYFITGLFGYLAFFSIYETIPGNIMQIFPKNLFQQIFLWGFLLNCTTGIPFMVNPTRGSLFTLWSDRQQQSLFGECHIIPRRLFIIFTAIIVFIPTFIAICIPNLEFALALTGATSGQLICYILPAIIALYVMPNGTDILKTKILMILGIISLVICTIMTFKKELVEDNIPKLLPLITTTVSHTLSVMNVSKTNVSKH
ncbi:unnamed protein product [Adineta steineri]|uniref:Amino acid transporter transmembrane domain-containing protein n=2 Tax=Adineta steineri TaxID=433720 RepID=A0A819PI95_9BILA|nr:unnamed protein product [Adineta steineri]CAF4014656.1 unnamed protein product [Adineta steineri]